MAKMKRLFDEFKPEVVVHFAAQSHVDTSFENSFQYINDNIIGTYTILECVKESGCRLVHISTDEVYGEVALDETSHPDTSVLNPTNPYSATKAGAELLVKAYGHSFKIPYVITRGNNVFGPKQYPEKVIPAFVTRILNDEPCRIHGTGQSRRNFIYVDDVSRAVMIVLLKGVSGTVYNIGTRNEYSVNEIFKHIQEKLGKGTKIHVNDRPHNDQRYAIDSSALCALGWKEEVDFESALDKTIEWYKANMTWYS
jgi:dTDP-glucose 4,6-dehydratase